MGAASGYTVTAFPGVSPFPMEPATLPFLSPCRAILTRTALRIA